MKVDFYWNVILILVLLLVLLADCFFRILLENKAIQ